MTEERKSTIRRNLNDMGMRDGEMQESKVWSNLYKGAGLWIMLSYPEKVLSDWTILITFLVMGIAPDLAKKVITMRAKQ